MSARTGGVRVASVPSDHAYVAHLAPLDRPGPTRLPDPDPDDWSRPATGRWWPPAVLDPAWVHRQPGPREGGPDLVHLHFGFDDRTPEQLRAWLDALSARDLPLVQTVHDLRNPHHADRAAHDAQLDVLVPAADALLTLTPGAAAEIEARWGRTATVVPHPHVVPLDRVGAPRPPREGRPFTAGIHLKARASHDARPVLPVAAETMTSLGGVLRVDAQRALLESGDHRDLVALVRRLADEETIELHVHDRMSDEELWAHLAGLDVSVLPYRWGTHSGWLEACRDLGTTVVAPTCGYLAEQGPVLTYTREHDGEVDRFDPASLDAALRRAHAERPAWGASRAVRRAQRAEVAATHDAVHAAVLGRPRADTPDPDREVAS